MNNKKKEILMPLIVFGLFFLIFMARSVSELGAHSEVIVIPLIMLAVFASTFAFVLGMKKYVNKGGSAFTNEGTHRMASPGGQEHSHDRLQLGSEVENCDDDDLIHYKRQLDEFLRAGIIERSEYNTLLEKFKEELG